MPPKKKHDPKTRNHARAETPKHNPTPAMTALNYIIGIVFAITLAGAFTFYQLNRPKLAILFGLACWISVGAGLAVILWPQATKSVPAPIKQTLTEADRPWVAVEFATLVYEPVGGKRLEARCHIRNSGKTPAIGMTVDLSIEGRTEPLPDEISRTNNPNR